MHSIIFVYIYTSYVLQAVQNLTSRDIRSVNADTVRICSFTERAEKYFQSFLKSSGTVNLHAKPYLHYLRYHTGDLMVKHFKLFGWGYGVYCCNAGEHLNKIIKTSEIDDTNLDKDRFRTVTHLLRSKQFEFTDTILKKKVTVTCSACSQQGHNKKNKSCPMHPSHPVIEFDDSDTE